MNTLNVSDKLKGKRVLVTAGAQGIGKAISEAFIMAGAHLVIHYFSNEQAALKLVSLAHEKHLKAAALQADLSKPEQSEKLVLDSIKSLGGLDILVNNAGSIIERRALERVDPQYWNNTFNLNLSSAQFVTQAAVQEMAKNSNSSIVNIASLAGRKGGHPGSLAYSTAKGALLTWTRALANEVADRNIRVNAVAPGFILGTSFHASHTTQESANETIRSIPLKKAGAPQDVARAVLFLASEYDGFITGATLDINGGVYGC